MYNMTIGGIIYKSMNIHEALEESQSVAREMLVEQFDTERGIPMRASSHTDLWPGDRWPEAYLAAGERELAQITAHTIARSVRPDGSFPHLMQGSHVRSFGLLGNRESRWIDRQVYRLEGNGAMQLPNGEWVTRIYAPPTQALSALALHDAGYELPEAMDVVGLTRAATALYGNRGTEGGLILGRHKDELTRNTAELARDVHTWGSAIDPAINALMVMNNAAIQELARKTDKNTDHELDLSAQQTEKSVGQELFGAFHGTMQPEQVLAAARLPEYNRALSEKVLNELYTAPNTNMAHPERLHLSMAENIEVARLTSWSETSHNYLSRILPLIAQAGASAMTRFEGIGPGKNAISNKLGRKHVWLPTAAEIVQIDATKV